MMIKDTKKLGALVVESGLATPLQIDHALQSQHVFGGSLGTNLVEMGIMDAQALAAFLSKQYGVPQADQNELDHISPEAIKLVPKNAADKLNILPLRIENDALVVAMMDPSDDRMIKKIEENIGHKMVLKIASELDVRQGLKVHYGLGLTPRLMHLLSKKKQEYSEASQYDEAINLEKHLDKIMPASEAIQYYFNHIQSLDKIPVVDYVGDITQYNLSSGLVFIFQQVDGVSKIQEIISMNIFSKLSTLRSLVYFSKLKMIRFMEK
jgi:hypothetical protein